MDYKELIEDKDLIELIPDISNELRDMPQKILDCMGLAIHQVNMGFKWILSNYVSVFSSSYRTDKYFFKIMLLLKNTNTEVLGYPKLLNTHEYIAVLN